jgi:hypothetical protein
MYPPKIEVIKNTELLKFNCANIRRMAKALEGNLYIGQGSDYVKRGGGAVFALSAPVKVPPQTTDTLKMLQQESKMLNPL